MEINPSSYPPQQPQSSGIGGTIATDLAAGAAVGVGMVAGEALMHHFNLMKLYFLKHKHLINGTFIKLKAVNFT